jgi:sigma-B regulation protein RsbU (phosphoserine phosphatase)
MENMLKTLNRSREADPKTILGAMRAAVDEFVGSAEQFDDLTMLCFEYKGNN